MKAPQQYSAAETERMMKLQDVLLKAMAKKITWWAAEILGYFTGLTKAACSTRTYWSK